MKSIFLVFFLFTGTIFAQEHASNNIDPHSCSHGDNEIIPTKEEISVAKKELQRKCQEKDAKSCYGLGMIYKRVDKNYDLATRYFLKACNLKNQEGCFYYSLSIEKNNYSKSKGILESACQKGSTKSCRRLGGYFKKEKKNKDTKRVYSIACEKRDLKACHELALLQEGLSNQILALLDNCSIGHDFSCRLSEVLRKKELNNESK